MPLEHHAFPASSSAPAYGPIPTRDRWERPTVELICLACEISAYAPDGDLPLF